MSDTNGTQSSNPTEAEIWPPPPKQTVELPVSSKNGNILFGKVADSLIGLFAGSVLSLVLTIGMEVVGTQVWVHTGHYALSNGHQPFSFHFWCLGLLLTLGFVFPLRRFSELLLTFVVSALGIAILTVSTAFDVVR